MDLTQLAQFRTLARVQHMTRAAEELGIAQPSLSKTIKQLESELGVALFDRPGRQIRLNQFGKTYLESVEQVFFALGEGRRKVRDLAAIDKGEISLAADALHWLPDILHDFKEQQPQARFRLFQRTPQEIPRALETGAVDFAFSSSPFGISGTKWQHLLTEEIYLAVPQGHRFANQSSIPLREIADAPLITSRMGCILRDIMDQACRDAGFVPNVVCEADEIAAIQDFVQAGLGVAFIPALMRQQQGDKGLSWVHLTHPVCHITLGIAWNEAHHLSAAASAFHAFITQYFAAAGQKMPLRSPGDQPRDMSRTTPRKEPSHKK